jgi:hypothetical protein
MAAQDRSPASTTALFTFADLIAKVAPDFNLKAKWKAVRHLDSRPGAPDLEGLFRFDRSAFEFYQSIQSSDVFGECEGIFSFLGLPGRKAVFIGAYRVIDSSRIRLEEVSDVPRQLDGIWKTWEREQEPDQKHVRYVLEPDSRFRPLELRAVIDWGQGAVAWHQWDFDKPVASLREGHDLAPCPDYDEIDISLRDLKYIYEHEDANASWRDKLSAVGGIYLLTDHRNNKLYVGQANGDVGFWGRWRDYANGRPENVGVDEAIASKTLQPESVTLSILQVIRRGRGSAETMHERENVWRIRLRTREAAHGYNKN